MDLSKGVKRQLKISAWILLAYGVALFIYLQADIQLGIMSGGSDEGEAGDAPYSELTWEILVVDPELRMKLWARYEKSPKSEREKAFLAVIHVLDSLSPEQAEHLAENLLQRSGEAPDRGHRKKLLDMLERLGSKFASAMKHIASFSARAQSSALESYHRRKDVQDMMDNIAREIKDTGYKYCLRGGERDVNKCTDSMVKEGHQKMEEHLRRYLSSEAPEEMRWEVLKVLAKNRVPFGKDYVGDLLRRDNPNSVKVALRLIREYELVEYRKEIQTLSKTRFETLAEDIDQTLSYLNARKPAEQ